MTEPEPVSEPVPELPVLVDREAGFRLRPWEADDAGALVEAWSTPDVAGTARGLAGDASPAAAAQWISGAAVRARAGLAIDLVVGPVEGPEVWGEVGLVRRRFRPAGGDVAPSQVVWEVGWWILPGQRGRGLARAAVARLGSWAEPALGVEAWVARIDPGNPASQRVAEGLGLVRGGRFDPSHDLWVGPVWVGPVPGSQPPAGPPSGV